MAQLLYKAIFFDLGLTLVGQDTAHWNLGAPALLSHLRTAGVKLGIISNTGDMTRAQLQSRLPTDFRFTSFDPALILLSSELHLVKPDLAIFRLAVTKAGVPANQCLYCSEDLVETLAAQRIGMKAARLIPPPGSDLSKLEDALARVAGLH